MTFPAKLMLLVISIVLTARYTDSDYASEPDPPSAITTPFHRSYLPPAPESDDNSAATLRKVLQRTSDINNALEQSDNILFLDADSDDSGRDDRFETLFNSHAHAEQHFAFRDDVGDVVGAQMDSLVAASTGRPAMVTTTMRRVIEGLPDASEDYVMIEGSSVADGEKIDPNLIKTLLG